MGSLPLVPPGKPQDTQTVSSFTQSCPILCDPIDCSTPAFPVHHQLLEFTQTHVHRVGDDIQPRRAINHGLLTNIQKPYPGFMSFKTRIECMLKGHFLGCFNFESDFTILVL